MIMTSLCPITCLLVAFLQAGEAPPAPGEIFNANEKARIEKADKVDGRIKVYEAASKRIQQALESAIKANDFQAFPDNLNLWMSLLSKSLEDIEANLKAKKKPRSLINYEIQVRKSITNMENFKIRVPVDQQDLVDSCLAHAEKVRKRYVEILFRH